MEVARTVVRDGEVESAAAKFGVSQRSVWRWLRSYKERGEAGLKHQQGGGRPRSVVLLNEVDIRSIVLQPAKAFGSTSGLWTAGRFHRLLYEDLGVTLSRDTIRKRLHDGGLGCDWKVLHVVDRYLIEACRYTRCFDLSPSAERRIM